MVEVPAGDAEMVTYRPATTDDSDAVRRLLTGNGWAHRVPDDATAQRLIGGATRCVAAWHGSRLVGFCRAITDDVSNGYLSMVVVDGAYRRRGVGTRMVRILMGVDEEITWVLRAGSGVPFWEALGFRPSEIAYERTRAMPPDEGS